MSFDPFRPEDAGDYSAEYHARHTRRRRPALVRTLVTLSALVLATAAALVAVAVA